MMSSILEVGCCPAFQAGIVRHCQVVGRKLEDVSLGNNEIQDVINIPLQMPNRESMPLSHSAGSV